MPRKFSSKYSASQSASRRAKRMYKRYAKYARANPRNFTSKQLAISGGAPRVFKMTRCAYDKIIGNNVAGTAFSIYNTNGGLATFPNLQIGAPLPSWSNTVRFSLNMQYCFSDIARFPELAATFSQFRITGVRVTIYPMSNDSTVLSHSTLGTCTLAQDYVDNVPAPDENAVLEMQGAKTFRLDVPFSFYLKPRVRGTSEDLNGTVIPQVSEQGAPWMDTLTAQDIGHYGTKLYFNNVNIDANTVHNIAWKIRTKYYFEMKDLS